MTVVRRLLFPAAAALLLAVAALGPAHGAGQGRPEDPGQPSASETAGPSPAPGPTPSPSPSPRPSPSPKPSPSPRPSPSPSPTRAPAPAPSPIVDCLAVAEGAVSFGDVDRDCDGTLLLEEQGDPIQLRRTVELAPADMAPEEAEAAGVGEREDRFEPTDFVPGVLVGFDETSEQGGTIGEGSLVYAPPDGFLGQDRFTFLVRGEDGIVREAEVVVDVRTAEAPDPEPTAEASPRAQPSTPQDAGDRALAAPAAEDPGERWEPPWMALLLGLAGLLLALFLAWWLFLVVRIQDRFRD